MKDDLGCVTDIVEAARNIEGFLSGVRVEKFVCDDFTQSAVIRKLEIIGEATRRLTMEFREAHAEVPWKEMIGLRNRLIHAYDDLDLARVWEAASIRLPKIRLYLEQLIRPEEQRGQL